MKQEIKELIYKALKQAYQNGDLLSSEFPEVELEEPKARMHGDFSSNIAMIMASIQKMAPRKIAESIINHMGDSGSIILKVEIAGPGFINFYLRQSAWYPVLRRVYEEGERYGSSNIGKGEKIQVEFVSSNPTGPLHVGHGRGAAVGDSVGNILSFSGYDVQKEYYINDSGRQINTLGRSVFLRYRELFGEKIEFPDDCYQGDYIRDIAVKIKGTDGGELLKQNEEDAVSYCARLAAGKILEGIRQDLDFFGVKFDVWFSEQSLYDSGVVDLVINDFKKKKIIYEKDGALWFKTSDFGDEKDRVVVKKNGEKTYFASDIAYHQDKYERGFDLAIDVWGADHHGYIPRMTASVEAFGLNRNQFQVILVQLVNLLRGGEPVAMSTRAGEFITLKDVISEVGRDAARFIFLTRHYDSPLDFDLELAKKKTSDNPVYYVQYVHARISSIIRKAAEREIRDLMPGDDAVAMLIQPEEVELMKALARYPETIENSAKLMEPHRITFFLMNLASLFHAYYNKHRVLTNDPVLSHGRLYLITAVQKVIRNGLTLLGVSAPDKM
ncbi:MAG: arginine--tRNA ligase [Desulfobacteraceae bacterium 4572_187]|nr:MAG: arginine--tRNA ligase [Desulfobacteraceae bacterium 4572_187]